MTFKLRNEVKPRIEPILFVKMYKICKKIELINQFQFLLSLFITNSAFVEF